MKERQEKATSGVQFAAVDGKRSSQGAGKAIFSEAVEAVDPSLASTIRGTADWRKRYLGPVRSVVEVGTGRQRHHEVERRAPQGTTR